MKIAKKVIKAIENNKGNNCIGDNIVKERSELLAKRPEPKDNISKKIVEFFYSDFAKKYLENGNFTLFTTRTRTSKKYLKRLGSMLSSKTTETLQKRQRGIVLEFIRHYWNYRFSSKNDKLQDILKALNIDTDDIADIIVASQF